jgi:hypothetical protein
MTMHDLYGKTMKIYLWKWLDDGLKVSDYVQKLVEPKVPILKFGVCDFVREFAWNSYMLNRVI